MNGVIWSEICGPHDVQRLGLLGVIMALTILFFLHCANVNIVTEASVWMEALFVTYLLL